ncbi:MAG: hypothetical protein L0216_02930 [Planctomycetales bacterium]|nr:hypothetical protein [Planctomycetales bacterium]
MGVALGIPIAVGAALAGRPDPHLASVPLQAIGAVPSLPLWADELARILPEQRDPVLTPLAAGGLSFPTLIAVAGLSLLASGVFLWVLAKISGVGERAQFLPSLACALHLKVLVLAIHWGGDSLASLAPSGTLQAIGGPAATLAGAGLLAAWLVTRAAFETTLPRAGLVLGLAVLLPIALPCLAGIAAPFVLAPLLA